MNRQIVETSHSPLEAIDEWLRSVLSGQPPARPFICSGSPLLCQVALVGANPASATPFWDHWNVSEGFNKESWLTAHARDPANDKQISRHNIDAVVKALLPLSTIELNATPYFSRSYEKLSPELKHDSRVLEYMLGIVRPKVLYASGYVASNVVSKLCGIDRKKTGVFRDGLIKGHAVRVLLDDEHFMNWPADDVLNRCHSLSERVRNQI